MSGENIEKQITDLLLENNLYQLCAVCKNYLGSHHKDNLKCPAFPGFKDTVFQPEKPKKKRKNQ